MQRPKPHVPLRHSLSTVHGVPDGPVARSRLQRDSGRLSLSTAAPSIWHVSPAAQSTSLWHGSPACRVAG
jgi:hypothetical protein